MDNDAAPQPPPLLHRLASRLSSLLGSEEAEAAEAGSVPVPISTIDPRWLGQQEQGALPRELLLTILSFLSLSGLGAFASTCRGYAALLLVAVGRGDGEGEIGAADAGSLYRCVHFWMDGSNAYKLVVDRSVSCSHIRTTQGTAPPGGGGGAALGGIRARGTGACVRACIRWCWCGCL
jgi:hypothetical protein